MAYLTFDDYQSLGFTKIDDKATFEAVYPSTELLLDLATDYFYNPDWQTNNLDEDYASSDKWEHIRAATFKKALAIQCEYFVDNGVTGSQELIDSNNISSVAIGRTTIQKSAGNSGTMYGTSGLSSLVAEMLIGAGFMVRAVNYR
ncbi:hypothetical protein FC84_GL001599 [Lapidilactobacillus dextrinicus DSM 20335]|uniref:Uncharacterized protein n=1 Tax=Lapidilactobacillus dextrinicus DSM 20335 TaxID=1423738 RepID=A0A0R2BIU5_9LACO|nr:hypothetical protein [Lapidilactobacillus dextrinicus]KRM79423.1 hypothetical protein FC84_GL001599 [Lapidilactobacillus dextrinicus DSM 20335]QFG46745.1 hypothetical protein LH506_04470 [Lapidilactobacillus dextrinicus]